MRYTLATGVLAGLVFLSLIVFGSGDSGGPPQQGPEPANAEPQPKPPQFAATGQTLPEKLRQPVNVEFLDTPLKVAADFLGAQAKLTVIIDEKALGIAIDETVTFTATKTPLYLVLNRILKRKKMAWYWEEGLLFITTKNAAEKIPVTRYYPMKTLLNAGYSKSDLEYLVEQMSNSPWLNLDGKGGELRFAGRLLVVRQSYLAHREIAQLLAALEQHSQWVQYLQSAPEQERTKLWDLQTEEQLYRRLEPASHAKLREALVDPQGVDIEFIDTPLKHAVEFLSDAHVVPFALDKAALEEKDISLDRPFNLTIKDQTLETALKLMLDPLDGKAILSDGTILITTEDEADEKKHFYTVIYNVQGIADNENTMNQLENAIYVAMERPWITFDGYGGLIVNPKPGTMIVRQNEQGHQGIVKLLQNLRRQPTSDIKLQTPPEKLVTWKYRLNAATAEDLLDALPELVAPETWKSEKSKGEGTIRKIAAGQTFLKPSKPDSNTPTKEKEEKSPAKPESKSDQTQPFVVPQAVLVIRQVPSVHNKIEKFLQLLLPGENIDGGPIFTPEIRF